MCIFFWRQTDRQAKRCRESRAQDHLQLRKSCHVDESPLFCCCCRRRLTWPISYGSRKKCCAQETRRDFHDAICPEECAAASPDILNSARRAIRIAATPSFQRPALALPSCYALLCSDFPIIFCWNSHANNLPSTARTWPSSLWWCRSRSASISRTLMSCSPCAACTLLAMSWF